MPATIAVSARGLLLCLGVLFACTPSAEASAARAALSPAASSPAPSEAASPGAAPALRDQRHPVLEAVSATLRERYVDLELAERMASALEEHERQGAFDTLVKDEAFADAVTADLKASSKDEHVALDAPRPPPAAANPGPKRTDRSFGFGKSERLAGNVAVLPIFGFPPLNGEPAQQALADALSGVANAAALIIDLRENNGGRTETMAMVISYFFAGPPMLLLRVERRYDGASYELWTQGELRGTRFGASKPLFLLTSSRTFSGGEALASELQARKRALVLGETTRGGTSLVERCEIAGGFVLVVPTAIAISAATGRSRPGGVVPDVPLPAEQALDEAHRRALELLAQREGSGG